MSNKPLNPANTICVAYKDGKEVGRIAATAKNAAQYLDDLAKHHGGIEVQYEENADDAMVGRMISGMF